MRKIILYIASSIDGYIARVNGDVDWIDTDVDLGDEYSFVSFLKIIDTIFMGRKSYEQALSFGKWPYPEHQVYVFSKSNVKSQTPNTTIVKDFNLVYEVLKAEGKDIWLFGGGDLNHFFLQQDLIDEIMLFIQPIVLGNGIGLFGNKASDLKKFKTKQLAALGSGFSLLMYESIKN